MNTGFDFTNEEVAQLPPSVLPLFSAAAMDWTRKKPDCPLCRVRA